MGVFGVFVRVPSWLVTPQGSSASPGWFVKVINDVIKRPGRRRRVPSFSDRKPVWGTHYLDLESNGPFGGQITLN